jgi:hypothetical protein
LRAFSTSGARTHASGQAGAADRTQILAQLEAPRDACDPTTEERAMPRIRDVSPFIPGTSKRPPPPPELDAREAKIWRQITGRLPADWFTAASGPMFKELCRHVRLADDLSEDIALARAAIDELRKTPEPPAKLLTAATRELRTLLRMHGLQSQRIGTLSTQLRLTPQSRYQPSTAEVKAAETPAGVPPWLDWGNDRPQ